jgi:GNAT superfamily N-acetyltransferase
MAWCSTGAVDDFLAEAGEFLRSDRVRNTVILTVTETSRINGQALADGKPARDEPRFGYWRPASGQSQVAGAFMHTPGFPVLLTSVSQQAATALAGQLAGSGRLILGINAAEDGARAFADAWRQHTGDVPRVHRWNRLFRLGELISPDPAPGGAPRLATARDRGLLIDWLGAFAIEVDDLSAQDHGAAADERLSYGGITIWEADGVPVSIAGVTRAVGSMVRVGPVYTPPAHRGHGYAAAVTAAVSQAALDAGVTDVLLYTDLANPTSNALYPRIGYRPVEDRLVLSFGPAQIS